MKLLLPVGFALMALQGISEIIKRIAALEHVIEHGIQVREAAAMIAFVRDNMAPLMFGGMILFMLIGYPAAFSLAATGLFFGFIGIELGLITPDFLGNLTYQLFGIVSNDLLLAIPFFTFMGAILERCGLAEDLLEFDRAAVRPGARRHVLCGDLRRRHPRRDHRHGRGFGHRHGRHLDAAHDQTTAIRCATPWA